MPSPGRNCNLLLNNRLLLDCCCNDGYLLRYLSYRGIYFSISLAALTLMVAYLRLFQQVRGSIPGGVVNFHLKIFNLGARRGGDVHFLIARLYITGLD